MSAPTTLLVFCHAREVTGYCPVDVQGTVLGIAVDLSALPYFLRPFSGPYRAGVPGRLVPVGSDCASWRRAVTRGLAHPWSKTRVGVRCGVWPGHPEAGWRPKRALRSERRARVRSGRRSSSARPSGRRLDHPSSLSSRYLGRPMSCALLATSSVGPSLYWKAGPCGTPGL